MALTPDTMALARAAMARLEGASAWTTCLTPPLPREWPARRLVYYAYGRRFRPGIADGEEVARPWARIDPEDPTPLVCLGTAVSLLGVQGVRPLRSDERGLADEVARAGSLEGLLLSAPGDPAAASLVRRHYRQWQGTNGVIAQAVLVHHAAFAAFVDAAPQLV